MPVREKHARSILESITEACFALDESLRFSYLNGAAERLLDHSSAELVGKHVFDVFPEARGTRFERFYRQALAGVRTSFVAYFAPHRRWYEVHAYPSSEGVSVFFHDVTERRRAEDDYRRSRDQLELVVRGAHVGVWHSQLPLDELIWDETVKEQFHLPADTPRVTIDTFYARIHPDDREAAHDAVERAVEGGEPYDVDFRTVSPDGKSVKWIRAIGRARLDDAGAPNRFEGISIDVSDRKRAELATRASEERYRLATRATNDLIWDWDLLTHRVRWNETLETRFGFQPSDHTGTADFWVERIHPADRERVVASIHRVIDDPEQEHWEAEYRFERKDGTYADVLDRGYVLRCESGMGLRMLGAIQDLTDRKRVERERERMIEAERAARSEAERQSRMKDEFLASLSHELRTPLNAILGWSQILLARQPEGSDTVRGLEVVERNARAQAAIIDELLDMSRLMSGKVRLDVRRLDARDIVSAAIETIRPAADAKRIRLDSTVHEGDRAWISGDAARLQQVLWNLLTNAIKFTPGGGRVSVTADVRASGLEISVSDTGEGIRPDFLPFVFERFRQADASSTRKYGGLGLGLSIVKQLVELHGGTISVTSGGPGQGSTFVVKLPVLPAASHPETGDVADAKKRAGLDEQRPAGPATLASQLDIGGVRVLVVDDDEDARAFVAQLLQDRRAVVSTAASADEAMGHLQRGKFDVLISDIGMPLEDGYSLIRRVRELGRGLGGDIPAIALTAYARAEDRVRAVAAGFLMHLTKPLEAGELIAMVAGAAGRVASST